MVNLSRRKLPETSTEEPEYAVLPALHAESTTKQAPAPKNCVQVQRASTDPHEPVQTLRVPSMRCSSDSGASQTAEILVFSAETTADRGAPSDIL